VVESGAHQGGERSANHEVRTASKEGQKEGKDILNLQTPTDEGKRISKGRDGRMANINMNLHIRVHMGTDNDEKRKTRKLIC